MFGTESKKVKRKDIPRGSKWIYDNYDDIIKTGICPCFVSEAIYDKDKRRLLKLLLKKK